MSCFWFFNIRKCDNGKHIIFDTECVKCKKESEKKAKADWDASKAYSRRQMVLARHEINYNYYKLKRELNQCKQCECFPREPGETICSYCKANNAESDRKSKCRSCSTPIANGLYCTAHSDPKCSICGLVTPIYGYSICKHCADQCTKCKRSVKSPSYKTVTIRDGNCHNCGHYHINKCQKEYEKVTSGIKVYYDTQIGPGLYYNNMIRREEPFRYVTLTECGCTMPTTREEEICIHTKRDLMIYNID